MDQELFDLCKEVYKRFPEWNDTLTLFDGEGYTRQPSFKKMLFDDETPLYTSDYILEKLPNASYQLDKTRGGIKLTSFYTDEKWETTHADTPLKALLKLVIALDDAGVQL